MRTSISTGMMRSTGMAGRGSGSEATGEKCPRSAAAGDRPATRPAPACLRCAFWQHFDQHPASIPRLPTRLRVALVDSDPGAHDFVHQTLKAHAKGWTLDSHLSPDSLLAALDHPSAIPHFQPSTPPTIDPDQPSTLQTINSHPEVVLMEARWPGLPGLQYVRTLIARLTEPRVVIFTSCAQAPTIVESLTAGALGCLIKPAAPGHLVYAISEAARHRRVLCDRAQAALIDFACNVGADQRFSTLTCREREVMLRLRADSTCEQIATALGISQGTVRRHLHDIYDKLRVHSKAAALAKFVAGEA